jgi:hypothetical protein
MTRLIGACVMACVSAACAQTSWPQPPAVDAAAYQKEYDAWLAEEQHVGDILAIVGIWPLAEGDTPFG